MADFVTADIEIDPTDLASEAYDFLRLRWPDFQPQSGNLEAWIIEANSRIASEIADLTSEVAQAIFRTFGEQIVNIPPKSGVNATANIDFNLIDTDGHTIDAGTLISIEDGNGTPVAFQTIDDVIVDPGDDTALNVLVRAVLVGTVANDLSDNPRVISPLSYVDFITLTGGTPSANGVDEEADDDYLNRLTTELLTLSTTPILPQDFAILTLQIPGVARAVAVDGWNPADDTTNNERYVGVVATDSDGEDVDAGTKTAIGDMLEASREVNFVTPVGAPTYATIDVTADVKIYPQFAPADVQADVAAALATFFDPANWGTPPFSDNTSWVNQTKVRYLDIAQIIKQVPGVHFINTLTFREHSGVLGSSDYSFTGVVGLTRPGTFNITAAVG